MNQLTRREATQLLHRIWGNGEAITKYEHDLIESRRRGNESLLRCVSRIAEVDLSDLGPADSGRLRARAAAAVIQMDIADEFRSLTLRQCEK